MDLQVHPDIPDSTIVTYENPDEYVSVHDYSFKEFLNLVMVSFGIRKPTEYPRQEIFSNARLAEVTHVLRHTSDWNFEEAQLRPRKSAFHLEESTRYAEIAELIEDHFVLVKQQ